MGKGFFDWLLKPLVLLLLCINSVLFQSPTHVINSSHGKICSVRCWHMNNHRLEMMEATFRQNKLFKVNGPLSNTKILKSLITKHCSAIRWWRLVPWLLTKTTYTELYNKAHVQMSNYSNNMGLNDFIWTENYMY